MGSRQEDALVRIVVQKLQGILEPSVRVQEEAGIIRHFTRSLFLTVLLDGLDETRNPAAVRLAIKGWLESRLGRVSILITSSRPDFWRRCFDNAWERCVPKLGTKQGSPSTGSKKDESTESRTQGFALPRLFTDEELRAAWARSGLTQDSLERLPQEVRQELLHPFTFRACAEILKSGVVSTLPRARGEIVALWLNYRVKAESDPSLRLSPQVYWKALIEIARRIHSGGDTCVTVDSLVDVPRFDSAHPPGPIVERLIEANILETLVEDGSILRFVFDTVFEFFLAEADIEDIHRDRSSVVHSLMGKSFSTTSTRISRIGSRIAGDPEGDEFLKDLADRDYARALVALQAEPNRFSNEARRRAFDRTESAFWKATRPEMAFVIERLGYVDCAESRQLLTKLTLPWECCPPGLHFKAAYSAIRLNLAPASSLVARCWWFDRASRGGQYFFRDIISLLRNATASFRDSLVECVINDLEESSSGTPTHARAVTILAYLADARLTEHLRDRLVARGCLQGYENHALIAVGSDQAAEVFVSSARVIAAKIAALPEEKDGGRESSGLFHSISPRSYDIRQLTTPPFEKQILVLMNDPDAIVSRIGMSLAVSSRRPLLLHHLLRTGKYNGLFTMGEKIHEEITAPSWLEWREHAPKNEVRRSLLYVAGDVPDVRLEERAIIALSDSELRTAAAQTLGDVGSARCLPELRGILKATREEDQDSQNLQYAIATALGKLRDTVAVELLEDLARIVKTYAHSSALDSLARIGTVKAEVSLLRIAGEIDVKADFSEDLAGALIAHGSPRCVAEVVKRAKQRSDGPKWLAGCARHAFFGRGHRVGEYYTHVNDNELVEYIMSGETLLAADQKWDLIWALNQIDSENVRKMLRELASRAGTERDAVVRKDGLTLSRLAHDELMHRGDVFSISYFVSDALERERPWFSISLEYVEHFPSKAIVSEVTRRLAASPTSTDHVARLISMLGKFGTSGDAPVVDPFLTYTDELVRNVAYETKLHLTDPLRLATDWDEMLIQ